MGIFLNLELKSQDFLIYESNFAINDGVNSLQKADFVKSILSFDYILGVQLQS